MLRVTMTAGARGVCGEVYQVLLRCLFCRVAGEQACYFTLDSQSGHHVTLRPTRCLAATSKD